MTAFGMISRFQQNGGGGPMKVRGWGGGVASKAMPTSVRIQKPVVVDPPAPRPQPVVEAFVNRPTPPVADTPAPAPVTPSVQADLPPILPAEVVPKSATAGFFDQELIPGVRNLYLAGGAVGVLLLLILLRKK